MQRIVRFITGVVLSSSGLMASVKEAEESIASRVAARESGLEREHMTGDWGGIRTTLVGRGIHAQGGYTAEVLSNVSGGVEPGTAYAGLLELALGLDGARLFGLAGSEFHVSSLYPHGDSISRYSGDLGGVSNIDGYDTLRLFELWGQQTFLGGRVSLRFGQLAADEEFAVSDHSALFLGSNLGWPPFFSANTPAPSYPVAAPGVRLGFDLSDRVRVQAAVFDGDPGSEQLNATGTGIRLSGDEGALTIIEASYAADRGPRGLPGHYKLGGWYHTGEFDHQSLDDGGMPLGAPGSSGSPWRRRGNWGVYFVMDQTLWREPGTEEEEGAHMFLKGGGSPSDRNLVEYYGDIGLTCSGLFPGRDRDVAGVGFSIWRIGGEARRFSREQGLPSPFDYELSIEGTYELRVNTWWSVQPDIQYVVHPGGSSGLSNALVVGLRSSIVF